VSRRKFLVFCHALALLPFVPFGLATSAAAQQYEPSIVFESLLDTAFHPSGVIAFDTLDVAFAPPPPAKGRIEVMTADGAAIASFDSLPDYRFQDKAFARMAFTGPAHVQLKDPGNYQIRVSIDGKPATVMPFTAKPSSSGDAFNPTRTWSFEGPWTRWGYFTLRDFKDVKVIDFVYWTGSGDLPDGKARDSLQATLRRGGATIAHSSGYAGTITKERFRRQKLTLFRPHEAKKEPNPIPFGIADLLAPGDYELRLERQSDGKMLRSFKFATKEGRIVPHPRTALTHKPGTEFIAPRVVKKGSNVYEFAGAEWLESK